jgi:glycosyltransferase involved in cell wall biosynthesis
MKICVVSEYYPRRRDPVLGIWAHRQALAARAAGADVRVLALERPVPAEAEVRAALRGRVRRLVRSGAAIAKQPRHDELDGVKVEYVRFLAPRRTGGYPRWERWATGPLGGALERLHSSWPIDVLHAHYALPAGGAVQPFASGRGIPLVVSVHGGDVYGPAVATPPARARIGEVLRSAAVVLCNSRATLRRAAALTGSQGAMRVVHLGAEAPPSAPDRRTRPTVATLGHVVARKRHADVARALALARRRLPDLGWVVIGDGPELLELRRLVAQLGVAGSVELMGQLEPDRALEELARCHLMALPSIDEAFGVAYAEALACGVPAIGCSGEGGPEEIASLGDGMLLVAPGDVEALARTIAELISDGARHARLSEAARTTAAENLSWERCGRTTVAAYEAALAGSVE